MGKINIEGLILSPLKIIDHPKGNIFHGMKKSDNGFSDFGEAYFSTVNNDQIKGWNKHKKMTLNLIVPIGQVKFVIYNRNNKTDSSFYEVSLSKEKYYRLTVPPGLWMAFEGKREGINLILNIASMEHDPNEVERMDLDKIPYNFDSD